MKKQPWIDNALLDGAFIIAPPFLSLLVILLFPGIFHNEQGISTWWWVVLILCIDVAHVYSTLYRTYFDKETFRQQKNVLIVIPAVALLFAVIVYALSPVVFWRILAYLAVYHFVRQQYGFMRIYSRKEAFSKWNRFIDKVAIYYATFYPILYWHLHAPRNFNWFVEGDFLYFQAPLLDGIATWLYYLVIAVYLVKEVILVSRQHVFNLPRNLVIAGTFLSWYFGIVYFNGDLAFTLLNVVSHGIPYMALIWIHGRKKATTVQQQSYGKLLSRFFTRYGVLLFIVSLVLFAYVEEGLWDAWVWKEHDTVFPIFAAINFEPGKELMAIIVPLLALPQITHYIIDGYIWKVSRGHIPFKQN
ncbi:MAG: hypothetical protein QM731_14145 [Chitinophagaceae bacterium]